MARELGPFIGPAKLVILNPANPGQVRALSGGSANSWVALTVAVFAECTLAPTEEGATELYFADLPTGLDPNAAHLVLVYPSTATAFDTPGAGLSQYSPDTVATLNAVKLKTDLIGTLAGTASSTAVSVTQDITAQQSSRWDASWTANGLTSTDWTHFVLTVKADPATDADADALLVVRVTNPADAATDGALVRNRVAVPTADRAMASLTVSSTTPNTTVVLAAKAEAMQLPASDAAAYRYELTRWTTSKGKQVVAAGDLVLERTLRRATVQP